MFLLGPCSLYSLILLLSIRFLFDRSCSDYKYYEYRLSEEEKVLAQSRDSETPRNGLCIYPKFCCKIFFKVLEWKHHIATNYDLLMYSFSCLDYDMLLRFKVFQTYFCLMVVQAPHQATQCPVLGDQSISVPNIKLHY